MTDRDETWAGLKLANAIAAYVYGTRDELREKRWGAADINSPRPVDATCEGDYACAKYNRIVPK